jgi:HPt (histidine-containing phosphotransfer) domain-containing protein
MLPIEKINFDTVPADAPEIFSSAVDLTVLTGYEGLQLDGEPDLIVELIDLYVKDAPRRMAVMRESAVKKNWLSLRREAHSLRGSSGNLGALQMPQICNEIEGIEAGDLFQNIEALLVSLEQELERVLCIFLAERQRRLL